jgi:PAS domain S-box-containing protein
VKDGAQYFEEFALSESPDALILMSPEGRTLHWSRGAEAIFGYGRAQVLAHAIGEFLIPTDRIAEEAQFLRETLEKGFATVRRRQNGALLYVDVTSRVVHEPAGGTASTLTAESYRRKGLVLGATQFIFRPIEPQELLATVSGCLRERV